MNITQEGEEQVEHFMVSDGKTAKLFKRENGKTTTLYTGSETEADRRLKEVEFKNKKK